MSTADKPSGKSFLSVQAIVLMGIAWAIGALLFFLLFSVTAPGECRPEWYSWGTSIFEALSYLAAALLCLRNWRSPQIVSGRNVWLGIGLGMLFYFIGNVLFSIWESVFYLEPDVSLGDFGFILTYIFLIWGMVSAVFSRRLNLEIWQWGVVAAIAAIGIGIAGWLSFQQPEAAASAILMPSAQAQQAPASPTAKPATQPPKAPAVKAAPVAKPATQSAPATPAAKPAPVSAPATAAPAAEPATAENACTKEAAAPQWALDLDKGLAGLKNPVNLFYVVCDVVLLVLATMLLLAFWGGRFSQSWRMIASAAFCLYIADIWFKYATANFKDYQSGSLPEVFWVFSGVLFAIGAALEHDISSKSRRGGSRRARSVG
jgi:hypothetical protein